MIKLWARVFYSLLCSFHLWATRFEPNHGTRQLLLLLLGSHQMHPQSLHLQLLLLPQFLHKNLLSNWATWSSRRLQNQLPARGRRTAGQVARSGWSSWPSWSSPSSTVWLNGPVGSEPLRKSLVRRSGWYDSSGKHTGLRVWFHGPVPVVLARFQLEIFYEESGAREAGDGPVPVGCGPVPV